MQLIQLIQEEIKKSQELAFLKVRLNLLEYQLQCREAELFQNIVGSNEQARKYNLLLSCQNDLTWQDIHQQFLQAKIEEGKIQALLIGLKELIRLNMMAYLMGKELPEMELQL